MSENLIGAADQSALILDLERRLEASNAKVEKLTKELAAFSYSVSHDLRSPLRSILGFSAALEEDYASRLDGDAIEYLSRIRASGQRMEELISAILSVSRISRTQVKRETLNLTGLAEAVAKDLQTTYPLTHFEIQPEMVVLGDPNLLKVVVFNLLENASKYSAPTTSPLVEFGAEPSEAESRFFVQDNGPGLAEDDLERIFEPFERVEHGIVSPGVGIGLTNVRQAIQMQGGKVWAVSKPGLGARFGFSLPAA